MHSKTFNAVKVPATNQVVIRRIELTLMSITLINAIIIWMRIMIIMMSMKMIIMWVVITLNAASYKQPTNPFATNLNCTSGNQRPPI